ncbi:GHMP family kinase ATP-binding protein [Halomonas denitrificans]
MNIVHTSAPGKLLLFGEYAVLAGGTAVVMAVDRRAAVSIETADAEDLHVAAPQLGLAGDGLTFDPDRPDRLLGLTGRLLAARLEHYGIEATGLRIEIDTGALFDADVRGRPVKLGLGSSAAVAAALDTALAALVEAPLPTFDDLLPAYRNALGAPASGADLVASLQGGLQRMRSDGGTTRASTRALAWPEGLHARPIWVGRPASTPAFAAAFETWRNKCPDAAADWVERMDGITGRALDRGTAAAWCAAAAAWSEGLFQLQSALGLEIVTAAHRDLAAHAADLGVAYKTCGAGGGDFGIALSDDPDALRAFSGRASERNGRPVELDVDPAGARVEPPAR